MAGEPILIVDDTPVNLKLTRILLLNEGFRPITAESAEKALELLAECHPHLILADVQLPGMDGLAMTRKLKADERTRDITVVALSASASAEDERRAMEAGCSGYITKPIDTRTLGARIREFLARRAEALSLGPGQEADLALAHAAVSSGELRNLRRRFLADGTARTRSLLTALDGLFPISAAAKAAHQWVGTAGLLGYARISGLSRELEASLEERPMETAEVREKLESLRDAFRNPPELEL